MRRILSFFVLLLALFTLSFGAFAAADPKHDPHAKPDDKKDDPAAAASAKPDDHPHATPPKGEEEDELPAKHDPVKMKIGIGVSSLEKLDIAVGTFNAEFTVTITCDKEPCKPELDVLNGKLTGKPEKLHDDKLFKKYKLKAELSGLIDLSEYPFDSHELPIVIYDKGDPEQITYEIDTAEAHTHISEGPHHIKLPGWEAVKWEANVETEDEGDGEKMSIVYFNVLVKRPAVASFAKGLVPILIMLLVAGFQLLLKPKGAAGRLSGSTGTLSAAVMFHVGQLVSLPSVGYLTRLDKFMIATYLVLLVHIIFNVMIVRADEAKNENRATMLYLVASGVVPGIALIAWLAVFLKLV